MDAATGSSLVPSRCAVYFEVLKVKNEEQTRIEEETKSSREIRGKGELLLGGMHGVVKRI